MAMQLRYAGEFLSIKGVLWRAEILQESDTAFDVGELTFEADEPLVIEWDEKAKHEPICSSSATLKIESPGDRTYADLYTEEVGSIRLDIYKEGDLYWQGCLDTEFYEEPYERYNLYAVTLTFSDFGVFDRLLFNKGDAAINLQDLLLDAITRAGLTYTSDDLVFYTTTFLPQVRTDRVMYLNDVAIIGSNFYDEEDEASSMQEAIEGMLQPLALKMIQRNGKIYIYDLNWAWYDATREQIEWSSDSQTLSVDTVYNNAKIIFSPYNQTIELPQEGFVGDIDEDLYDLTRAIPQIYNNSGALGDTDTLYYISWDLFRGYLELREKGTYDNLYGQGFVMWLTRRDHHTEQQSSKGLTWNFRYTLNSNSSDYIPQEDGTFYGDIYYFKIVPLYLGEDAEGIMLRSAKAILNESNSRGWVQYGLDENVFAVAYSGTPIVAHASLYVSDDLRVPTLANKDTINLLVKLDVLLSAGYSPWHDDVETNDWRWSSDKKKSNTTRLKEQLNYMVVPIRLIYTMDSGDIYAWTNVKSWGTDGTPDMGDDEKDVDYLTWTESLGTWTNVTEKDKSDYPIAALAYYPSSNLDTDCADIVNSFGSNHQYMRGLRLSASRLAMGTETQAVGGGQMVCMPVTEAGKVYVEILSSWCFLWYDKGSYSMQRNDDIAAHIRWCLMKAPQIEMVSYRPWDTEFDTDDIEYSAYLNEFAKEDIELDTICGTGGPERPSARGALLSRNGNVTLTEFVREDLLGTVEELLLATLYSQYGERHTTLSGEAYIQQTNGFTVFTDRAQDSDTLFLATEVIENLYQDCGDMKFVELSKDDYEPK